MHPRIIGVRGVVERAPGKLQDVSQIDLIPTIEPRMNARIGEMTLRAVERLVESDRLLKQGARPRVG
jgi:hypothetical protein